MTYVEILQLIAAGIGFFALFQIFIAYVLAFVGDHTINLPDFAVVTTIAYFGLKLGGVL